jgi:chromosome segregation ATPase
LPVYGISEWDHNYIKLTSRSKELNAQQAAKQGQLAEAQRELAGLQGEMHALNYFVSTWTCPYGMMPGMINWQSGGMGSGIIQYDGRPIQRVHTAPAEPTRGEIMKAMTEAAGPTIEQSRQHAELLDIIEGYGEPGADPAKTLRGALQERGEMAKQVNDLIDAGEDLKDEVAKLRTKLRAKVKPRR